MLITETLHRWLRMEWVTRNWLMLMEHHEPFDIGQWMWVMPKMSWKLENDAHLGDTDRLQSSAHQCTLLTTMRPGTYHHAQKQKPVDLLHPTQKLY